MVKVLRILDLTVERRDLEEVGAGLDQIERSVMDVLDPFPDELNLFILFRLFS
jgi:hypothetical protein